MVNLDRNDSTSCPNETVLSESDVRAIVRLLGRVAGSIEPLAVRKRMLMNGLCELIDADMWTWIVSMGASDPRGPTPVSFQHNVVGEQYATYVDALMNANEPPPHNEHAAREYAKGRHFTRRRTQWLTDNEWYNSKFVKRFMKPSGLDDFISSVVPLGDDAISGVGVVRASGKPQFTERETRIVHIILSEVDWLHYADLPDEQAREEAPKLTPRQRSVLIFLLDGKTRREIADELGISEHTANDHVKAVYKRFGVNSHTALLQRFRTGDGGDVA